MIRNKKKKNNNKATKKFSQNLALKAISHSIQFLVKIYKYFSMPFVTPTAFQTESVSSTHSFSLYLWFNKLDKFQLQFSKIKSIYK
jgi:hypothetical protein